MSEATEKLKTRNQLITDFDLSKIFIFDNRFEQVDLKNTSGGEKTFKAGTLLGRVSATLELDTVKSAAADGSETPFGILAEEITLADAEVKEVNVGISGDVAIEKVILDGADTLDTLIDGRPIRDKINADTMGIKLTPTDELTDFDNS